MIEKLYFIPNIFLFPRKILHLKHWIHRDEPSNSCFYKEQYTFNKPIKQKYQKPLQQFTCQIRLIINYWRVILGKPTKNNI